jgi:hypothetical protein
VLSQFGFRRQQRQTRLQFLSPRLQSPQYCGIVLKEASPWNAESKRSLNPQYLLRARMPIPPGQF